MQSPGGVVRLAAELAARMQRGENDLQCAEIFEFRMRINRNAAAIVPHREPVVRFQRNLDEAGVTRHRLVHRVVQDLGGQMVQRVLVGAADIHARAAANRFETFQNLDVLRGIIRCVRGSRMRPRALVRV